MTADQNKRFFRDPDKIAVGLLSSQYIHIPEVADDEAFTQKERDGSACTLVYWHDEFYHWRDGRYFHVADSDMKTLVVKHMQGLKECAEKDDEDVRITTQNVNNVLLCLKGQVHIPSDRELNTWLDCRAKCGIHSIAFENGVLLFSPCKVEPSPSLAKLTPHFFNLVKLPYSYDPEAKCTNWLNFLDDVMQGNQEYITLLQQWCGYLFRPDLREQKFLLYVGEGANGKGVFSEVIEALIGVENCSHISLCRFSNPFALYGTYAKLANITNESSHLIDEEGESLLKAFVAGDRFTFERKFKDPIEAVPTAKVMISTNALPRFNDKTQGIWRRILLVPFEKTVPEGDQIKGLAQEIIKNELPGVFNWGLGGLVSLNRNNGFIVPARNDELMEAYRQESDPARAFLVDCYTFSPNASGISCSEVYEAYRRYCEGNGCRSLGSNQFGKQVRRVLPGVERVRKGRRDSREWLYTGLVSQVSQEISI